RYVAGRPAPDPVGGPDEAALRRYRAEHAVAEDHRRPVVLVDLDRVVLLAGLAERQCVAQRPRFDRGTALGDQDDVAAGLLGRTGWAQDQARVRQREALVRAAIGGADQLIPDQLPLLDRNAALRRPEHLAPARRVGSQRAEVDGER